MSHVTHVFRSSLVVLLAACSGSSSEPVQILAHGIVAGNNQVGVAGAGQLSGAVVEQMVRNSTGQLSLRRVPDTWRDRVLDLAVPRAFAQGTVVNGSPVVGAVVCAVSVDPAHQLVPFTPCTNTGNDGKATFFFSPGTGAGEARAEIRGTVASAPAVFDTARATIRPDVPTEISYGVPAGMGSVANGGSIDLHRFISFVRDKYGNFVAPSSAAAISANGLADTTTTFTPIFAVRDGSEGDATITPDATGWIVPIKRNPTGRSQPAGGPYASTLSVHLFTGQTSSSRVGAFTIQAQ